METISHILWGCVKTQKFWKAVNKWLRYVCNLEIELTEPNIILNNIKGRNSELLNTIVLLAKQYIYAVKCLEEELKAQVFVKRLYELYYVEQAIAMEYNRKVKHDKKWKKFKINM